jgi:GNAT superfamily N-acetyltransferase
LWSREIQTTRFWAVSYGEIHWGWLNILTFWVTPHPPRHGLGTQLLARAKGEASAKGCHGTYLDTFTFQGVELYTRAGYEIFDTLEQFPNGHSRHFLREPLHAARVHPRSAPGVTESNHDGFQ